MAIKFHTLAHKAVFLLAAGLCLTPWISAPIALLAGAFIAQTLGNPFSHISGKAAGLLLKASVVGLGFGMNVHTALQVGRDGLWLTVGSICLVLALGHGLGHLLHMPRRVAHLLASGTAICGGSAIAAVGPAVRASGAEMSVALGVIFLLNSVALLLFPVVGHLLDLNQAQFGMWCAIAIHDTSSVVGAASAYGNEALQIATTVKLARTLWIIPLVALSAVLFRNKGTKITVPLFVIGFILAMLCSSYLPLPAGLIAAIVGAAKVVLVLCLFLIGTALSLDNLRTVGWKPLVLGLALWAAISVLAAYAVLHM